MGLRYLASEAHNITSLLTALSKKQNIKKISNILSIVLKLSINSKNNNNNNCRRKRNQNMKASNSHSKAQEEKEVKGKIKNEYSRYFNL